MISQHVRNDQRTWDEHLDEFKFAMNTSIHDSTKFTPAMLNFCRELKVPKALYGAISENKSETMTEDKHCERFNKLIQIKQTCEKNLKAAYQRQARYYNLRRRDNPFRIGDKVLKRTHILSSAVDYLASKLAPKFEGPYTISDKIGVNILRVVDEKGKEVGRVHAKDLKPYYC